MEKNRIVGKIGIAVIALCVLIGSSVGIVAAQPSAGVTPPSQEVGAGDTFTIDIDVDPDTYGVSSGELQFAFDASVMQVDDIAFGDLMASPSPLTKDIDNTAGTVLYAYMNIGAPSVPTDPGTFATITITVDGDAPCGTYDLDITSLGLMDEIPQEISGIAITDGTVTVEDDELPTYSNIVVSPASPMTYTPGQTYTFNITVQDNVAVDTVLFEFDGVNRTDFAHTNSVFSYELTDLAAGTYSYKWYMNDTSDNWNSTASLNYVINKAATSVNLLLNGTDDNLTVDYGESVNMNATLSIFDTLTLYVDGVNSGSGTGSVGNVTTLGAGKHNITAS